MTPAQKEAMKQIKELRFTVRKQNQWDEARTQEKMEQQPHMAIILDEQLEERKAKRQYQITVLYNLLDESLRLSDFEAGLYMAFDANCQVQDLLNPTDEELDQLNVEQIITIQLAKLWQTYFPELTYRQAVVLAMVEGNPHVQYLLATNPVAVNPDRPKTIKIKRGYRSVGLKTQAA